MTPSLLLAFRPFGGLAWVRHKRPLVARKAVNSQKQKSQWDSLLELIVHTRQLWPQPPSCDHSDPWPPHMELQVTWANQLKHTAQWGAREDGPQSVTVQGKELGWKIASVLGLRYAVTL